MNRLTQILLIIICATTLAACGTLEVGVEQPPTTDSSAATVAALATQNAELANRVATLTAPTLTPTREQITAFSALPPGLVFGTNTGLWQVGEDGRPRQILNRSDVVLSPDGTQALYTTPDADLWLIDLTTGAERNLTHTPDRMECCPQWWPARPDTIIFGSWPKDADLGPSTGFLTTVRVDGSDYRVLSEHQSNTLPAPAPDGQTIACDQGGTAYLYRWDTGPVPFDPAAYGLPVQRIGSPAWSPDGGRLAWVVGGDFGQRWRIGLGVFDLEARTARLLHPFEPRGVGGWPGAAVWSPDGQWLAYAIWPAADPNEEGICVFRADGEEEHCLGPGGGPVWSPDGRRLAFRRDSALWLAEAETWDLLRVADDAWPVAWLRTDTSTPTGPEGQLALLIGGPPLSLVNLAGGPPQTLGAENMATDSALFFQWSPDGEKIVYGADADLWLLDAKSGESQNLTDNDRWDLMPAWSPDGDWIAFTSRPLLPGESKTGAMQGAWGGALAVIGANGIGFRILDDEGNVTTPPSWTPTGRRLAYAADGEVRLYDLDTSQRTVLSPLDFGLTDVTYMGDPAWSPDGRFIAACFSRSAGFAEWDALGAGTAPEVGQGVILLDLEAQTAGVLFEWKAPFVGPITALRWQPGGSLLLIDVRAAPRVPQQAGLWLADPSSGRVTALPVAAYDADWSPDGRWIAAIDLDDRERLVLVDVEQPTAEPMVRRWPYSLEGLAWRPTPEP